jgi:hypothetical protein
MTYQPKEGEDAKTRDGRRVTGLHRHYIEGFEGRVQYVREPVRWNKRATFYPDGGERPLDLIGPWVEPAPTEAEEMRVREIQMIQTEAFFAGRESAAKPDPLKAVAEEIRAKHQAGIKRQKQYSVGPSHKPFQQYLDGLEDALAIVERHMKGTP